MGRRGSARSRRPRRARSPPCCRRRAAEQLEPPAAIMRTTGEGKSVPARANSSLLQPRARASAPEHPTGARDSLSLVRVPVCGANLRYSSPWSTRSRRSTSSSSLTTRHLPPHRHAAKRQRQLAGGAASIHGRGFLLPELDSAVRIRLALALLPSLSSFPCRYIPSFASVRAPWPLRPPSRPPAQRPNPRPSALLLTPSCWQLRSYRPKSCHNEIRAAHGHWISTRGAVLRVVRRAFIGLSIA